MALVRICGVRDDVTGQAGGSLCRLRNFAFTWAVVEGLPGVADDLLIKTYGNAWAAWERQIGIRPKYTEDARNADILVGSRVIDGPSGVLAEAQLPCGNYPRQLLSWFDTSEAWIVEGGVLVRRGIPLFLTAAHEFGHHLGLGHSNAPGALMAPTLNTEIDGPQADDVREGRARYGPAILLPPPVPTTPPPWNPTTPPPTVPGDPMDRTALKSLIGTMLGFVNFLAKFTPTQVDDKVVVLLTAALSNDALLDFLLGLLNKIPTGGDPTAVLAVVQAHMADAEAVAALHA